MAHFTLQGVISDLDGVVYRGEDAVPGAVEAFRRWRAGGVPYAFVTNNATKSAPEFAEKLARLGVDTEPGRIVTACSATGAHLVRHHAPGTGVYAIGERALHAAVEEAGMTVTGEEAQVVVLGFDYALTYDKLRTAVRALLNGADLVVTNPDLLTPAAGGGFEPCVGAILAALLAAAPGARPAVVGKPEPIMVEDALARIGTPREGTIMVGDQVATDIVSGRRAGLRSVLVETGVPGRPVEGYVPDAIVASLLEIA